MRADRAPQSRVAAVMQAEPSRASVRVLLSVRPSEVAGTYVVQLVEGLPGEVSLVFFSWKAALRGAYDVFHVHWPEFLVRGRNTADRLINSCLFAALLLRLKISGMPLVRTVHNLNPHEVGPWLERVLLRLCDERTALFVRLNAATDMGERRNVVTIPHGHYKDCLKAFRVPSARPGRFLYFGLIRPYKGVDSLLSAFTLLEGRDVDLRIVGKPSGALGETVLAACRADSRISARLEFVDDETLAREIGEAQVVVLPYREMHNSGSLLMALSLDRPVVAPDSAANRLIAEEVGREWLYLYEGALSASVLSRARASFASLLAGGSPRLHGRDWKRLGEAYYQAYLQAVAISSGASPGYLGLANADPQGRTSQR